MSEEVKVRSMVISESDREFHKDFGENGKFSIRIPLPVQKANIISATSRATGGLNITSMRAEDYEYIRMIVTLNNVITSNPDWWKGADSCMDEDFLYDLWKWYTDSEKEFQGRLKKNMVKQGLEGAK